MFKVDDIVKLKPNSRYDGGTQYNPRDINGKIISIADQIHDHYISVKWDNGKKNEYDDSDLVLVATAVSQETVGPVSQETVAQSASITVKSIIQSMEANGVPSKLSVKIDDYIITIRKK